MHLYARLFGVAACNFTVAVLCLGQSCVAWAYLSAQHAMACLPDEANTAKVEVLISVGVHYLIIVNAAGLDHGVAEELARPPEVRQKLVIIQPPAAVGPCWLQPAVRPPAEPSTARCRCTGCCAAGYKPMQGTWQQQEAPGQTDPQQNKQHSLQGRTSGGHQ